MGKLTPKQRLFALEFLKDLNAAAACVRAGYSSKGAKVQGCRLLTNDNVQEFIQRAMVKRSERCQVDADAVLVEAARLAFSDMRDYLTWGPDGVTIKPSDELSDDAAAAVAEIVETQTKDGSRTVKLKLHDKRSALELVGKHVRVNAFKLGNEPPAVPSNVKWEIEIVHTDRESYERRLADEKRPPIEHKT